MFRLFLLTVALAGLVGGGSFAADDDKKDTEPLQGTWTALSVEEEGLAADDLKGHQLSFSGNKFTIKSTKGKLLFQGTYRLDAGKKPATIDFRHTRSFLKGKTWKGIYALEKDTLKICDNGVNLKKARPSDFATAKGTGHALVVFQKAKS